MKKYSIPNDIKRLCRSKMENCKLHYNGDNAWYILHSILPYLHLTESDKQVVMWAYGEGESHSYEMESDGETVVKDYFLGGVIKSPAGVCHDYVNRVPGHKTPDGHVWTRMESNNLYYRICKAIGYPPMLRFRRWLFLSCSKFWWK